MSSRKYRKQLREKRIMWLHQDKAAWMFFKRESDERYNAELSQINSSMSADEIMFRTQLAHRNFFGSAYMNYMQWHFGLSSKLSFTIPARKGKLRAKDLIVNRVTEECYEQEIPDTAQA